MKKQYVKLFEEFSLQESIETANSNYEIEYYYRVGEHSGHSVKSFESGITEAEVIRDEVLANEKDDTEYVGVQSYDVLIERFAVIYVTDFYLNTRISEKDFANVSAYQKWIKAAQKCLETETTQIGYYNLSTNIPESVLEKELETSLDLIEVVEDGENLIFEKDGEYVAYWFRASGDLISIAPNAELDNVISATNAPAFS